MIESAMNNTAEILEMDEWDLLEIDSSQTKKRNKTKKETEMTFFNQPTGNTEATKTSISLETAIALIKAYSSNVNILEIKSTELLVKYKHIAKVGHIDQRGFIIDVTNAYSNEKQRMELDTDILRVIPSLLVQVTLLNMSFAQYAGVAKKAGFGKESYSLFWEVENFSEEWGKQPLALKKALIAYSLEVNKG